MKNMIFLVSFMNAKAWSNFTEFNRMEDRVTTVVILFVVMMLITLYTLMVMKSKKSIAPLPPGPRGIPLLGNLPFLKPNLPRYLADVAKVYGPIFKLQLGSRLCIIMSSPSLVKEVLQDHDVVFANHDTVAVAEACSYGGISMGLSPYGENWRMIRKVCVGQLLNNQTLESLYGIRQRKCHKMVQAIESVIGTPIKIRAHVHTTLYGILSGMLWGGSLVEEEKYKITSEFRKFSQEFVDLIGEINISDIFPALRMFDLQRKEAKMKKTMHWFDKIFDEVIERRLKTTGTSKEVDFLQVLLQCRNQVENKSTPLTINHIKSLFLEMMLGGTISPASNVEWTLAELMLQPDLIHKAQEELKQVVGLNNAVEESHLPKLPYLNAIVKESMRLHPGSPLLLPRRPSESCVVGGYLIPEGAKTFINAWAIHRDPAYWDKPLEFRPERFMDPKTVYDYRGTSFHYLPFGTGRRICAGIPLAGRLMHYLLATLLHSFDWKLQEGVKIDMSEAFVFDLTMKVPLVVIPMAR